mgnify:CR=1 FL=1
MTTMSRSAVIDASVIILLLAEEPEAKTEAEPHRRWTNTRLTMEWAQEKCDEIVVPAPVLAELAHADKASRLVLEAFVECVGAQTRIEPLDQEAAQIAGELLRALLPERKPGEKKHVMKYDVMISAIAHRIVATYLITGDKENNSFPKHLELLGSSTVLVVAPDLPRGYQTEIAEAGGSADANPPRRPK